MDILELIKKRHTIRKYQDKPVSADVTGKIIEAGRWSSSIHGMQPWHFIVIKNKEIIGNIAAIMFEKSKKLSTGGNVLVRSSAESISNAQNLILVYNTKEFSCFAEKLKGDFKKTAWIAEICGISAAIQNMILAADSLGLGTCWFSTPLFCEEEINKLIQSTDELLAIISLGYANEKGKRSKRKSIEKAVRYL